MSEIEQHNRVQYIDGNFNFSSIVYGAIDKQLYSLYNANDLTQVPDGLHNLYVDENHNVFLGYTPMASYNRMSMTYSFILDYDNKTYTVNNQSFDNVKDLLIRSVDSTVGEFTFTDSQIANTSKLRCDDSRYGPIVFLRPEDPDNDSDCKSPILQTFTELKRFTPFLSIDRIGHLIYVELPNSNSENQDLNLNNMPKACVTISEILKLMLEWSELVNSPWNSTEPISVKSNLFFENLSIPSEVRDDLINNQADMQVARYLMGNTNARERPPISEINEISPILRRWILSKFFFSSIDELKANLMV